MSETGALWDLIQVYMHRQRGMYQREVSQADIARALDTSPQNVHNWTQGAGPKPENLVLIRDRLRIPYSQLLDAYLKDKGYLPEPQVHTHLDTPFYDAARDAARELMAEAKEADAPQSSRESQSDAGA